jgi:hypothetical protein
MLDISFLTGADNDADGRSVVAGDFRNNGQLDKDELVSDCRSGGLLVCLGSCPWRGVPVLPCGSSPGP